MKCLEEQTLHRFMRGELEEREREAVQAHVDVCPACRRVLTAALAETVSGELGDVSSGEALATTAAAPTTGGGAEQGGALGPGAGVDHFRVKGPLGAGGMGEVYLAEDTQLRRKVALKLIRPLLLSDDASASRLLLEAQTTARFNHPNIVTIHHVGTHDGAPYLALEYLDGETLRQRAERGALEEDELVDVLLAVSHALQEAHRHGVLHRDLKPENVMLPRDGRPRVLDFGLSAARAAGPPLDPPSADLPAHQSVSTHHHSLRGTPAYMAPEQWRGEACTEATDIWALGVMLHELTTGVRPFVASSLLGLYTLVLDERPAPAVPESAANTALRALCQRCLDKRPEGRPGAAEVVEVLESQREALPAAPGAGALAYFYTLTGVLFAMGGLLVSMATISGRVDGTSEDSLVLDLFTGLAFGLGPVVLGALWVHQGLKRGPHLTFLVPLSVLVAAVGTLSGIAAVFEILEGGPQNDPLGFNLFFLIFLGLVPLGLSAALIVRGNAARQRRRPTAASPPSPPSPPSTPSAVAPTERQRRP